MKFSKKYKIVLNEQKGSAIVMLLITMSVFMIVTTSAITISYINNTSTTNIEIGDQTFQSAESGSEEALLKLIRDSDYLGESLTIDGADVTITVSTAGSQNIIISEAEKGGYKRKVQVTGEFSNGAFTVNDWGEIN